MSETISRVVSRPEAQLHNPEEAPLIRIEAAPIVDAFSALHTTAFGLEGKDPADVTARYIEQRPVKDSFKKMMMTGTIGTAGITSSFYFDSLLPGMATATYLGVQEYQSAKRDRRLLDGILRSDGERLQAASEALGDTLGGLEVFTWRDATERQIVLEIPRGATKDDNREIAKRLGYLETVLASKGALGLLGGYIMHPELAEDAELEVVATAPLVEIMRHMGKKATTLSQEHEYAYVERISDVDTATPFHADVQRAIELIRIKEPNHALVKAADTGASKKSLQLLAQQALQERLSEVRRHGADHPNAGGRYRTNVLVQPQIITTTGSDGRTSVLPTKHLHLPNNDASLLAMSAEQIVAAAEFTVYKHAAKEPAEEVGDLEIDADLVQETLHADTDVSGVIKITTRAPNGIKTASESVYIPTYEHTKKRRRIILAAACLATLSIMKGCEVHSYMDHEDKEDVAVLLGTTQAEIDAMSPVRDYLTTLEKAPVRVLANMIGEKAPPPDKLQIFKDLIADLGMQGYGNEAEPKRGLRTATNRPEWFISAPEGVDISGYWGVNRYEAFAKPGDRTAYSWFNEHTAAMQWFLRQDDNITIEDRIDFEPPLYPQAGQETIEVTGAISLQSHTIQDGLTWIVANVPVLHQRDILAVEANIIGIDEKAQDITTLHKHLPIRRMSDSSGTVLFIAIPQNVEASNAYISLRYNLSTTPTGGAIYAEDEPADALTYDQGSGQKEASELLGNDRPFVTMSLQYEIDPVEGKDTNSDGVYNLEDLATEILAEDAASCFQANTLFAAMNPGLLAPVSGYLLSDSAVAFDDENNDGIHYLASRDSHLYTVDFNGKIFDVTPSNPDEETRDYLSHVVLEPGEQGANLILNSVNSSSIQRTKQKKTQEENKEALLALASALAVGAMAYATGFITKRQRKRLLDVSRPLSAKAAKLALLSEYKLAGNPTATIVRDDFAKLETPRLKDLAAIQPKAMKRQLKQDRQKATYRYAYTKTDIARATKIVRIVKRSQI